jgi:hypothetical protein
MRVYWIDIPSVSKGLKRTYNKKLEVYSGILNSDGQNHINSDKIYRYTSKGWKETPNTSGIRFIGGRERYLEINVPQTTIPSINNMRRNLIYSSLEMAQVAKIILIEDMKRTYEQELEDLRTRMVKNIPKTDKPLKELKDEYPE